MVAVSKSEARAIMAAERAVNALPSGVAKASGSIQLGPFLISYALTASQAHVDASVNVGPLKAKLFSVTLSPKKPSVTASANVQLVKASLTITVNFSKMTLTAKGKVCRRTLTLKWKCAKYNRTFG